MGHFRSVQGSVREIGGRQFRLRLDLARQETRWLARRHQYQQCGHTGHGQRQAAADLRRVGTRLLHRLSQPAARLPCCLLESGELGVRRQKSGLTSASIPVSSNRHVTNNGAPSSCYRNSVAVVTALSCASSSAPKLLFPRSARTRTGRATSAIKNCAYPRGAGSVGRRIRGPDAARHHVY